MILVFFPLTDENKKTSYVSYDNTEVRKLLAKSDNKYCIYWYHYSPGFILKYDDSDNADNTEYLYGNFAGANWKRITHIPKTFTQAEFSTYGKDIFTVALNEKKEPVFSKATTWTEDTQYYIECINIGLPQSPSNIKVLDETGAEVKDDNGNNLYYYPAQGAEGENIVSLYLI